MSMTAILTTGDALYADIVANPDDDTPRLIYADWLEDNGQAERAEFIRGQIELAKRAGERCMQCQVMQRWEQHTNGPCRCPMDLRRLSLRSRELLRRPSGHGTLLAGEWWAGEPLNAIPDAEYLFRRGFVASVKLPQQAWLDWGPVLVREHPLERVELSDKKPYTAVDAPNPSWRCNNGASSYPVAATLDDEIWSLLVGYIKPDHEFPNWKNCLSTHDAIAALSAACLAWAKSVEPKE